MNYRIILIDNFKREAKPLLKKYPSLRGELETLHAQLLEMPRMGIRIAENIYKIRLAVKSEGRGKSGGMRVITYVWEIEIEVVENQTESMTTIFLASIYDKSEEENISDHDLGRIIDDIQDLINE
ncbi:MAG: hypothetical protein RL329_4067 [Bacteroidota bacterium]|jgi:mRNA-degrading endonuclease RelE of RelBE toxin-antitoxin system